MRLSGREADIARKLGFVCSPSVMQPASPATPSRSCCAVLQCAALRCFVQNVRVLRLRMPSSAFSALGQTSESHAAAASAGVPTPPMTSAPRRLARHGSACARTASVRRRCAPHRWAHPDQTDRFSRRVRSVRPMRLRAGLRRSRCMVPGVCCMLRDRPTTFVGSNGRPRTCFLPNRLTAGNTIVRA
jgi:hypothetical protein